MSVDKLAVIVITDGLRRDSIEAQSTPALDVLRGESVWLRRHRSAAPSVTRVCSATIATGCYPLRHELAGNKLCLLDHGKLRLLDGACEMSEYPRSFLSAANCGVMCSAFLRLPKELRRRAGCGCTAMPRPAPLMFRIRRTADMSFTEPEASVRAGNSRNPKHSM